MAQGAVFVGEHGVGGIAHQRVTERVLGLVDEARIADLAHDLASGQRREPTRDLFSLRLAAEQRGDAAEPSTVAEHAGCPQHSSRLVLHRLQPRLHHGQHRVRQGTPLDLRPRQLLQVEGVAVASSDELVQSLRSDLVAQRCTEQAFTRAPRERAHHQLLGAAVQQKPRKVVKKLRAGHDEQEERQLREIPERGVQQRDRSHVSPLEILEHQQHRAAGAFLHQQVLERRAELIAHQHGIAPGGIQLWGRPSRHAAELRQELAPSPDGVPQAKPAGKCVPQDAEGSSGPGRVPATDPDARLRALLRDGAQ